MNTCSNCKYAIPEYYSIYRSFDLDFVQFYVEINF